MQARNLTKHTTPTDLSSMVIHLLDRVEESTDAIIAEIPKMGDDQLLELRIQAKALGRAAFQIECAADSEILRRESMRRGPGVRDTESKGVEAAVKQHASAIGVHPRTIYENARIHQTFFNSGGATRNKEEQGGLEVLEEKEFFRLALKTDDPHATIQRFAAEKAANPSFTTRDARREVYADRTPSIDSPVPPLIEDSQVKHWYEDFVSIISRAPAPGLRRILRDSLDEVRDFVQRPTESRRAQLLALIRQGIDELDLIAKEISVDRMHVIVWLNRLTEDGTLTTFEKQRPPGARGQTRTGYRIN